MKKGIFITIEGIDGSGKTTQIILMEKYLRNKGYDVLLTREPGGTVISEKIRSLILDPENKQIGYITEMLLYASARAQLVYEVIKPAINEGKIVICDRFVDSSYAYQGFGRGIDLKVIAEVNRIAIDGMVPDITFFLDITPQMALKRRIEAGGADRIESEAMEFHNRVYNGYKKLAILYPERIKNIDAQRSEQLIFNDIKEYLEELIK